MSGKKQGKAKHVAYFKNVYLCEDEIRKHTGHICLNVPSFISVSFNLYL